MTRSRGTAMICVALLLVAGLVPAQGATRSAVEELTKVMPDDTMLFVATSGADALKDDCAKTILGKLCTDPGVQAFYTSIKTELLKKLGEEEGEEATAIVNMVLQYAQLATSRPIIAGMAGVDVDIEDVPPVCLFAILDAGSRKSEIATAVAKLEELIQEEEGIVETEVASLKMHTLESTGDIPLYWGWVGDRLVLAINDPQGAVVKHVQKPRFKATNHLARLRGHGDILAVYCNIRKIREAIRGRGFHLEEEGLELIETALEELGIAQVRSVVGRLGMSGSDLVSDSFAETSGPRTGLLAALKPIDPSALDVADAQAVSAMAFNLDLAGLFDTVMETLKTVSPDDGYPDIQKGLAEFELDAGFEIRDGLLKSLGGPVVVYALPAGKMVESPMGGFVAVVKLNDPQQFEKILTQIGALVSGMAKGMVQIGSQTDSEGRTTHIWSTPPAALAQIMPAWSIVNHQVIIGSNPGLCTMGVRQVASKGDGTKSLIDTDGYKKLASRLPGNLLGLTYVDSQVQFNQTMMQVQQLWPFATMMAVQADIKLPVMLPSLGHIAQEMQPSIRYSYVAPDGLRSHYQGPGVEVGLRSPGGGAGGALAVGILMPALARTRQLAFRMTSGTNLSGIGKACLIYADDHDDNLPPNLEVLVDEAALSPRSLISKRKPKGLAGPSYIYIPGQTLMMNPGNVVAYEDPAYCIDGANVLFLDCHVEFMKPETFREEVGATYERLGREVPKLRFRDE